MKVADNRNNIFISNSKSYKFAKVLELVQEHIVNKYSVLLKDDKNTENQIKSYIQKFLDDNKINVDGLNKNELINKLYINMAKYSFLTEYIESNRTDIEEININSWDDIKITYTNGDVIATDECFISPDHAIDVIRRLLRKSNMILDSSKPLVRGFLNKNIRITAIGKGIVDDDVGVSVSIRIVNPQKLGEEDFIKKGTGSKDMMSDIKLLFNYGISMCVTGATSTGKTTFMEWLLSTVNHNKRIFTIEEEVREFNLVKRDENNRVLNNVIHTVTRHNEDESKSIDEEKLLEIALTSNPDFICVAEMKGSESFSAQEAARTGHTVITTTHANSCDATYRRMVTLCKTKYSMDDNTLYELVTEAFPIVIFIKKLEDNSRRIMEIKECSILEDGKRELRTLYKFKINKKDNIDGRIKVYGEFVKVNNISKQLQNRLIENGMTSSELERILK